MSPSQDEARAARIQKYKEDRRKQLTAKTATLFSANVTDRRARRECPPSDETAVHLKSSSELNLATASTSVPIRTTRTSRLRAAAANVSDTSPTTRKSNRSSSAQSLLDDNKTKPSKIIERDKRTKRQSNDAKLATFDGAKTKSKHSNVLEKDKSNFMTSPKGNEKPSCKNSNDVRSTDIHIHVNGVELFDEIVGDHDHSIEKERIDDLFNDLLAGKNCVELKAEETGLNNHSFIQNVVHNVKVDSVVPKVDDVKGLLGAVCVRKVERFSELLSNLCSPCEADVLFEDILVENGINGLSDSRTIPECTPPCRRSLPSPRLSTSSTPKRSPAVVAAVNDAAVNELALPFNVVMLLAFWALCLLVTA